MSKNINPRAIAAQIIKTIIVDKTEFKTTSVLIQQTNASTRPLIRYLCFQTLRFYPKLNCLAQYFIKKKLKPKDQDIVALILIALLELENKPESDYSIVNETVNAALSLKKEWAKNLINAVLRNYLRAKDQLPFEIVNHIEYQSAHPQWLITLIKKAWPQDWINICQANNQQAPLALRVNRSMYSRQAYTHILDSHHIHYQLIHSNTQGLYLETPIDVHLLPGFNEGAVSVQDPAGQLAADLLELAPHLKILDACAAPGSKTAHILETEPSVELLALDISAYRVKKLQKTLDRLGLNKNTHKISIQVADSSDSSTWPPLTVSSMQPNSFDRILLDAPCSALGVIRRHPDIKLLRTPEQIKIVCEQQRQLLHSLWPLLKPGGILLYATCSILPQENEEQIKAFYEYILKTENNIEIVPIHITSQAAPWGIALEYGRQILPGQNPDNMDGFYYAKLKKILPSKGV